MASINTRGTSGGGFGGSSGGGFGGSSGSGWSITNPADAYRLVKPAGALEIYKPSKIAEGLLKPVTGSSSSSKPSGGGGGYGGGGNGGYAGNAGNEWYMPDFQPPTVDRSVYENLANDILNSQLSSLGALRSTQEAQATSSEKAVRGDYFDQYRQAQYNRAGRGMGGSPMGSGEERQVQLAMADTLGDIRDTLAGNLNQIGSQEAQAKSQKNINAEQMFQQQQAMAFDQAVKQYQMQMQKMGMDFEMAQANSYGSGGSAMEQYKAQQQQAQQQSQSLEAMNAQIAMIDNAIAGEKDTKRRNDLNRQKAQLQNQMFSGYGGLGGNSNFQPFNYTPESVSQGGLGGGNSWLSQYLGNLGLGNYGRKQGGTGW